MATTDSKKRGVIIAFTGDKDIIEVDACLDETHQLTNTVTDHPVEEGFNVTDHSRPNPDEVTLRCFISNTPITLDQKARTIKSKSGIQFETTSASGAELHADRGRAHEAFVKLKKMRDEGTLIKVATTLRTYESSATTGMAIMSLSISRQSRNYDGLEFTIQLKQVRIVKNRQTSDRSKKDPRTGKKKKEGNKVTKDGAEKDKAPLKSILEVGQESGNNTIEQWSTTLLRR